jgi:hypothetical protein
MSERPDGFIALALRLFESLERARTLAELAQQDEDQTRGQSLSASSLLLAIATLSQVVEARMLAALAQSEWDAAGEAGSLVAPNVVDLRRRLGTGLKAWLHQLPSTASEMRLRFASSKDRAD